MCESEHVKKQREIRLCVRKSKFNKKKKREEKKKRRIIISSVLVILGAMADWTI